MTGPSLVDKHVRLLSILWFMRFLSEQIAKEASKQNQCTGRFLKVALKVRSFWMTRPILACMQYVDLNPVREDCCKS